jgi:peptidyl-prolyl cis-trans isomerase B (cyclophilin B)
LVLLTAIAGCGHGGDNNAAPTAAIGAPSSATPAAGSKEATPPAKSPVDTKHPIVLIETSLGNITIRLDADKAQLTVDNFLSYVRTGYYDKTIVHQVYKSQGFLAGGYGTDLIEKKARPPIFNEAANGLKNRRGTIAMVRLPNAIDSATCQFFINVADNPALDYRDRTPAGYGYCVFGEVTEGLDTIEKIAEVKVCDTKDFERAPEQQIVVKSIRQIR